MNVLAEINNPPYGRLRNMTPYEAYSITTKVHTGTLLHFSFKKGVKPRHKTNIKVSKTGQYLNLAKPSGAI